MLSTGEFCRKMVVTARPRERRKTMDEDKQQYSEALAIVAEAQQASVSMLQRKMRIGYSKAAKLIQQMEDDGHIGPYTGTTPRLVHIRKEDVQQPKATKPAQEKAGKAASPKKAAAKGKTAAKKKTPQKGAQKATAPKKSRKGIGGRPELWMELDMAHKLDAVTGWCMQGATMSELAEMLGISEATLYKWRAEIPEFKEALRAGRNVANGGLLASAFKTSTGYHVKSKAAVKYKTYKEFLNPKTGEKELKPVEEVKVVDVTEYVAPNAQLLQFMLYNRMPDQYRKTEHVQHSGGISDLGYMSDEELEAEMRRYEGGGASDTGEA